MTLAGAIPGPSLTSAGVAGPAVSSHLSAPVASAAAAEHVGAAGTVPTISVGKNLEVGASVHPDWTKREPAIAVDPRNPMILAAGAIDGRLVPLLSRNGSGHAWDTYYRSTDGGKTWSERLIPGFPGDNSPQGLASPVRKYNASLDPSVAFDRAGNVYFSGIAAHAGTPGSILHFAGCGVRGTASFVAQFANDGSTYVRTTIFYRGCGDFPRLAVDTSGGPYDGTVYAMVSNDVRANAGNGSSLVFRSSDGARSFSKLGLFPSYPISIAVDSNGTLLVAGDECNAGCASGKSGLLVSTSADGGTTFRTSVIAAYQSDGLPLSNMTLGGAQVAGDSHGIYLVFDSYERGHWNVKFVSSTNGGSAWTAPITVNDVGRGVHGMPTIAVYRGVISVAWYDSRNSWMANGTVGGLDVYYAQARVPGASFSVNVRVTTVTFDPNLVRVADVNASFSYQIWLGDYIWISSGPSGAHVIWTDNRNACDRVNSTFGCVDQDIYTATVWSGREPCTGLAVSTDGCEATDS